MSPVAPMTPLSLLALPAAGEDVVVDPDGTAYVGCADGAVYRVDRRADGSGACERVAATGGRPLGLELLDDERLVVCDTERGLLAVHRRTGAVETLVDEVAGAPLVFCNNAAVAPDGAVWFTDSSRVHGREHWHREMVEGTRTGRLLCRRPDGAVEEWLDGLDFANGVVLAPDGTSVLVAETGARRVRRVWLGGGRAGQDEVVLDDLPGYPDNMSLGSDGRLWVALASPTVALLQRVRRTPLAVRRAVARVPTALQPGPTPSVHVQAYDLGPADGSPTLAREVHGEPGAAFAMVTGVREHQGTVWLASLEHAALALVDPA